ncbi:hypothetical protein JL721_9346 [Aureococcus anophagefferens]|nr:hypothetical protein JL721_9346 [Aureococcus anophagefferens]
MSDYYIVVIVYILIDDVWYVFYIFVCIYFWGAWVRRAREANVKFIILSALNVGPLAYMPVIDEALGVTAPDEIVKEAAEDGYEAPGVVFGGSCDIETAVLLKAVGAAKAWMREASTRSSWYQLLLAATHEANAGRGVAGGDVRFALCAAVVGRNFFDETQMEVLQEKIKDDFVARAVAATSGPMSMRTMVLKVETKADDDMVYLVLGLCASQEVRKWLLLGTMLTGFIRAAALDPDEMPDDLWQRHCATDPRRADGALLLPPMVVQEAVAGGFCKGPGVYEKLAPHLDAYAAAMGGLSAASEATAGDLDGVRGDARARTAGAAKALSIARDMALDFAPKAVVKAAPAGLNLADIEKMTTKKLKNACKKAKLSGYGKADNATMRKRHRSAGLASLASGLRLTRRTAACARNASALSNVQTAQVHRFRGRRRRRSGRGGAAGGAAGGGGAGGAARARPARARPARDRRGPARAAAGSGPSP